jgi:peptide/nickel transport system ATP-binding protein
MAEKTTTLLRIRNLSIEGQIEDETIPILRDVSIELRRGEILGLIGESGAGKSTLGTAAMGIVKSGCRVTGGSIEFDGIDLLKSSEEDRRRLRGSRIAYVAQSAAAAFNPAHRLIDQVIESSGIHAVKSRAEAVGDAQALFKQLMMPEPARIGRRFPHQVSGGQLQRAMTAMAMSCRPDLIIFDEPTTALDVTTQVGVLIAIREIVERFGTAAIYISHDLALVAQMAHRIVVLRHGRAVEEAETRQMLREPRHDYTKTLWAVHSLEKPGAPAAEPLLRAEQINAGYRGIPVLHDVSVEIQRGHTVAVVGESGSGKTTLARVIAGLMPVTTGRLTFDAQALPIHRKQRSRDDLRRIQMVYQSADTALNPRHTVRKIIGRPLQLYFGLKGAALDRGVRELLGMIDMQDDFIDRYPGELSGGQKQRVSIARALAAKPELIICDEVTSALDQVVQEGILKLLMRLQRELEVSYLFITHDLATVKAIADEVVVMHRGRVIEHGPKTDIFAPPHEAYTETLLASVPQMDPDWLTEFAGRAAVPREN